MAESVARKYEPFSHPLRVLILALLLAHGRLSWTALMKELGKLVGPLNPNTLAFHLKKLVESGYVVKSGGVEELYYEVSEPERLQQLEEIRNIVELIRAKSVEGS
ncbi:MAG: winged helix-turn-helix domain-containing protein [Sulfolobales archaeon]